MIPFLDEPAIRRALPPAAAVAAITAALAGGLDPAAGVPRSRVPLARGEFLLMPAESAAHAGVKVLTVAPGNPERGLPLVNAVYVLFDAETLRPRALLDGTALTTLRTPAVSVAAVLPLLAARRELRVVVFGAGPQGVGHEETLRAVCDVASVAVVTRRTAGSPEVAAALREADVVVCATTSRTPVFDSAPLRDDVVVIAVGAHEATARELDSALCARSTVIVEDVATAMRESGDVIQAVAEGAVSVDALVPMAEAVRRPPAATGPVIFKSSGMSWEDLVVAEAVAAAAAAATTTGTTAAGGAGARA
jgi:ornithine cyclodeaminase/alanine dehydrogenase-like protein (mu-crystallin family)